MPDLVVKRADLGGPCPVDVRIRNERIVEVGPGLAVEAKDTVVDAGNNAVVPGLHDHHVHLMSAAAARSSLRLGPPEVTDPVGFREVLVRADRLLPEGEWIRAVAYHESVAGVLDRHVLDAVIDQRPVRVQHRSGAQWILNTAALRRLPPQIMDHPGVEREPCGALTGCLLRMDSHLAEALATPPPGLRQLSTAALRAGVVGLTDATPLSGSQQVRSLVQAAEDGEVRQRLTVMSAPGVQLDLPPGIAAGPVKILLDDVTLPSFEELGSMVDLAHRCGRAVAIHCVTRLQTVLAISVLGEVGPAPGDRLEHGAVVPGELLAELARLKVTVVTNPSFIYERGDAYLDQVPGEDLGDLWRTRSLVDAGVFVAAGTDAPFGAFDPWRAVRVAAERLTAAGAPLGPHERMSPVAALSLFWGSADAPASIRTVASGQPADLCLLHLPFHQAIREPSAELVAGCIMGQGTVVTDLDAAVR